MARALDKGHILVVDDEETIVTVITDVLTQAGYNALGALSGEAVSYTHLTLPTICSV